MLANGQPPRTRESGDSDLPWLGSTRELATMHSFMTFEDPRDYIRDW